MEDSDFGHELVGGALLYEKNGTGYTAPIPYLASRPETTTSWFFGTQTYPRISGVVSYPFGAQNQRGYVLYIMYQNGRSRLRRDRAELLPCAFPVRAALPHADRKDQRLAQFL